ncbi:CsbD family protein [Marinococcus sp. PL1-022]|uniref:CsbD family protein n=1 Tax=Marinococcus sp. PL1-022 TaxID=3095363 RepID=UPI0029C1BD26|nr:CsbD family protein [Marinococcus sp. PL1-022]MDX6153063.1 CsbD family protein [Marinococcus sp. PL1-022]
MSSKNGFGDKLKGNVNKVKGEAKDRMGSATNNSKMQREGKKDKIKGVAQDKKGDFKNK